MKFFKWINSSEILNNGQWLPFLKFDKAFIFGWPGKSIIIYILHRLFLRDALKYFLDDLE